jgi:hypothetical protein
MLTALPTSSLSRSGRVEALALRRRLQHARRKIRLSPSTSCSPLGAGSHPASLWPEQDFQSVTEPAFQAVVCHSVGRSSVGLDRRRAALMMSVGSGSVLWSVRARRHRRRKKRGDCLLAQRATTTVLAQGRERSFLTDRKCGRRNARRRDLGASLSAVSLCAPPPSPSLSHGPPNHAAAPARGRT